MNRLRFSTSWSSFLGGVLCCVVWAGCSSTTLPATGDVRVDLLHVDPRVRIHAAQQAVQEDRVDVAADLVRNLRDDDAAVRMFTVLALRRLSGRSFGYKPYGTVAEREEGIARWEEWLGSSPELLELAPEPRGDEETPAMSPTPDDG